jgi:RHS repeat-associated protein
MCLAQTPEMFGYDADGNLTNDGKWSYTWDAENRLAGIQSASAIPAAAKRQLAYAYDNQGRRIYAKIMEWNTNTASYQLVTEERYWYDGWNMIGRADLATALVQTFVWGLDLSGSLQGAGGVGGLLMLDDSQGASYFYDYDGNGNVLGLVNAHDGTTAAQYDYGPFGELLRANGMMARANPMRFSTKFQDEDSGLVYYGYRYYKPSSGTWLSRDPIAENGSVGLYAFVQNDGVNCFDLMGLADYKEGTDDPPIPQDLGAGQWGRDKDHQTEGIENAKLAILAASGMFVNSLPDAVAHLKHYFDNTGTPIDIRLQNMINDVTQAKKVYIEEVSQARAYVESLPPGAHDITSGSLSDGYNREDESKNWFFAVAGYKAWGKGKVICKNSSSEKGSSADEYVLQFEYKFYDRYNWDIGKEVSLFGIRVTDKYMGSFHLQGLAKEFDMRGSLKKTVKWKKGGTPTIIDGWTSEGN